MAASIVFKALFTWQIFWWFLAPTCILHLNPQGIRIPLFVMEIRIAGKKLSGTSIADADCFVITVLFVTTETDYYTEAL